MTDPNTVSAFIDRHGISALLLLCFLIFLWRGLLPFLQKQWDIQQAQIKEERGRLDDVIGKFLGVNQRQHEMSEKQFEQLRHLTLAVDRVAEKCAGIKKI